MGVNYLVIEGYGRPEDSQYIESWETPVIRNISSDASEAAFWKMLRDEGIIGSYVIIPTCGNGNIRRVIDRLADRSTTDKIISLPDWYGNKSARKTISDVNRVMKVKCAGKNKNGRQIDFLQISNYTFEWAIISSLVLTFMARPITDYEKESLPKTLYLLQKIITQEMPIFREECEKERKEQERKNQLRLASGRTEKKYSRKLNPNEPLIWLRKNEYFNSICDYCSDKYGVDSLRNANTFEQLCSFIAFELLNETGFSIQKGNLGDCWIYDCCHSLLSVCGIDDKSTSRTDKLKRIIQNSSVLTDVIDVL